MQICRLRWYGSAESNCLGPVARRCPLPNAAYCHTDAVAAAVFPAVTAACRLLAVSPRGYTFPSACCDLSTADPFRLVLRQVTGRGGTDQTRTGGLLIPNQARYQLRYGSTLAADGGVEPHGFHRALFSRQAPRPLEFICHINWRFCTMHDQESNLTVWGLEPRCTSKDDRHPILRGIGHHHAMSLCRISLFVRFSVSRQTPHLMRTQ